MSSIHDRARGRWMEIWTGLFGIDPKVLDGKHHPCPGCGGDDRFRVNLKRLEHGVWFCGGEAKGGIDLCMHVSGMDFKSVVERIEELVGKGDGPMRRELSVADRVMAVSRPLVRSRYLESRGLEGPFDGLFGIPSLDYYEDGKVAGSYPAIIAPLRRDGKLVTVQATYLQGGKKAPVRVPKKTLPGGYQTINGAVVRLGVWKPGMKLGFSEGVETALSASLIFGHPVWATLSTSGMVTASWPDGLKEAVIYADHDKNFAGHAAAWQLAHKMAKAGVSVEVRMPPRPGTDWNDVLNNLGDLKDV